jgi:hypothetical protein
MGRYEEPNRGFPVLGSQYLMNYSFVLFDITDFFKGKNETLKG